MLTDKEQSNILRLFPNVELSYETVTHKNVLACDFVFAIPEGSKFFYWVTMKDSKPLGIFMEVNTMSKQVINIKTDSFYKDSCELCKGSIFYGTMFQCNSKNFFSIEDVLYFQGKNISHFKMENKIKTIYEILYEKKLTNTTYNNDPIFWGLPLIFENFSKDMNSAIQQLPYKISRIQFYKNDRPRNLFYMNYTYRIAEDRKTLKDVIFQVKPDFQNDIYHLYANNNNELYFYDIAHIPDYKTSVMMNGLFRTIKENIDLDFLEESDDEEEFQNDKLDKYVDLNKTNFMVCNFSHKFKKWVPTRILENATIQSVIKKNDLLRLEKNKQ